MGMIGIGLISLLIFGAFLIFLIAYFIMIYNNLIALKNNVSKNWSNIDVILKQRNSEIPKLIETCKKYMSYEKDTLEKIVKARSNAMAAQESGDMEKLGLAEGFLKVGLGKLFALAENYPDLKANTSFNNLQQRISSLEEHISDRRELYNESVNLNNIRIEQFPDVIIANMFNFKAFDLLKFTTEETKDVDVKALFE